MDVTKTLPLLNKEGKQIQFLIGLFQEAEVSLEVLEKRLALSGQTENLKAIAELSKVVTAKMLPTIPAKKLGTLIQNTKNMQLEIHQKRVIDMRGEFTSVPTIALRYLCSSASEECKLCFGKDEDYQGCELRKALDEIMMVDVTSDMYKCPYKELNWCDAIDQST